MLFHLNETTCKMINLLIIIILSETFIIASTFLFKQRKPHFYNNSTQNFPFFVKASQIVLSVMFNKEKSRKIF